MDIDIDSFSLLYRKGANICEQEAIHSSLQSVIFPLFSIWGITIYNCTHVRVCRIIELKITEFHLLSALFNK